MPKRIDVDEGSGTREALDRLGARLEAGDEVLGMRLFVVQRGAVQVFGATGGIVALDAAGHVVLVLVLPAAAPGAGAEIADELDRIARLTPAEIGKVGEERGVEDAHAAFFGLTDDERPELNHDQQAVVVVGEQPDVAAWKELIVELRDQLAGVYAFHGNDFARLEIPEELRRRHGGGKRALLAAAAVVLLGAAILLVVRYRNDEGATPGAVSAAPSVVVDVAAGVPGGATHNQWIGQDHLVRAADGTLLAVFGTEQGLQIAADHVNQGRAWHPPVTVSEDHVVSSSVAIDERDRLHVAFSDGGRVAYTVFTRRGERWIMSPIVELDAATPTLYLDVAHDEASDLSHVVWVEEGPEGQSPRWAAISNTRRPRVVESQRLAPAADDIPVLVNVASGRGLAVTTYRRGDSPAGWFARAVTNDDDVPSLGVEEPLPTEQGIGAADVALDDSAVAHLVLRDSTTFELAYFTRNPDGAWSAGESVVDAEATEEIDFPSLTLDRTTRLVYIFFQNDRTQSQTGVQVAVRDPARGWERPRVVAPDDVIPDGAFFPASIERTAGAPIVVWTKGGAAPVLQASVVVP